MSKIISQKSRLVYNINMAGRGKKKEIDMKKLKALCEKGVLIFDLCKKLGVSKSVLYARSEKNKEIRKLLKIRTENAENRRIDTAVKRIEEIMKNKKDLKAALTACIFVLKTQAGWTDKVNIDDDDSEDNKLVITIKRDNKKREEKPDDVDDPQDDE